MTHNGLASMKRAVRNVDLSAPAASHGDGTNVGHTERDASMLGGALLVGLGLARIAYPTGWAMLALGGGLLYRGVTGQCGLYKRLGVNTAE